MLFLRPKDKEREIWDGRRLGVEDAPAALGVDEAHDVARLWDELPELLSGHEAIAWRFGDDEDVRATGIAQTFYNFKHHSNQLEPKRRHVRTVLPIP